MSNEDSEFDAEAYEEKRLTDCTVVRRPRAQILPILPTRKAKAKEWELLRVLEHLVDREAHWVSSESLEEAHDILGELERRYLASLEKGYEGE